MKKKVSLIAIIFLLFIFLTGCEFQDVKKYNNSCTKITEIYHTYYLKGSVDENIPLDESKYGKYVSIIKLEISYIKESDAYYKKYNKALDGLDAITFNGDLKAKKTLLDKNLTTANTALNEYKKSDELIDTYVKKFEALNIDQTSKTAYVKIFKSSNLSSFDKDYISVSEKALSKYKEISTTLGLINTNKLNKNTGIDKINKLCTDINNIYEQTNLLSSKYSKWATPILKG